MGANVGLSTFNVQVANGFMPSHCLHVWQGQRAIHAVEVGAIGNPFGSGIPGEVVLNLIFVNPMEDDFDLSCMARFN